MSCVEPLKAFWTSRSRDAITFDIDKSATRIPFALPCGKCIGCRMEYARQWGMRCLHEKKCWPSNYFVTLTYANEMLPPFGDLCLRDVQLFMKRLRKKKTGCASYTDPESGKVSYPIRFFMCGEYGDENYRPHYHALLFNLQFRDLVPHGRNARGEVLYTSRELSELWSVDGRSLGFCTVGEVTFDSAVYCAKYAMKKLNKNENSPPDVVERYNQRYVVTNSDGEVYERRKEFAVMSRRPGIGAIYYERFGSEVLAHDSIVINGREVRPPRFYDLRSKALDPDAMERHKRKRKRLSVLNRADNTKARLRVKRVLMETAERRKERRI